MSEVNHFKELAKINVNGKTEQKGKFTYLSWAFAVEELMKADPMANWEIHEPKYYGQQVMVSCTVTAFNKPIYMWLPVMDFKNQAMNNPDVMAINKTIMRCLVKAIACHGIGLYIYAGEDLPSDDDVSYQNLQQAPVANAAMQQGGQVGNTKAIDPYQRYEQMNLPTLQQAAQRGTQALQSAFSALPAGDFKATLWSTHSAHLKQIAQGADGAVA